MHFQLTGVSASSSTGIGASPSPGGLLPVGYSGHCQYAVESEKRRQAPNTAVWVEEDDERSHLPHFRQIDLQWLHILFEPKHHHRIEHIFTTDGLSLLFVALLCGFRRYEANEF